MASIRNLKKEINYLTYELLNECFTYKKQNPGIDQKKADDIIKDIIKKRNELIHRIHHPSEKQDKKSIKDHYRKIINDYHDNFNSILSKLNDL